jgi:hypothetical protein
MKSIIPLSAITGLAALALVGCNQNSPNNSTETPTPNSSMNHDNGGMMDGTTNMVSTTNMPDMNTNMPPATNMPNMDTNMPASTNQ